MTQQTHEYSGGELSVGHQKCGQSVALISDEKSSSHESSKLTKQANVRIVVLVYLHGDFTE